ncbi:class I SAM-dependent methyltransferase [Conexibacter sp. DBS9H8]|uniref:class I SAM-dependent methyltransferase n=1 Tax=Conexibacter sp. DBS9H8 TaxID=2937801 RepID=UPI0020109C69|nr:class I SAM-dependent methyltransferase [Conexibacter sp. DBS9H8]
MSDTKPAIVNTQQEQFWNDVAGPLWVAAEDQTERQTAPFGEAALARAAPAPGEAVLDVGCGCGATTAALAVAAGVAGRVVGVDLSAPMLARAAQRVADQPGVAQVEFRRVDAQVADLGPDAFDLVFSRFGVMFFADPVAGFGNLRRALAPGGRLVFVCWQTPTANPWMAVVNRGAAEIYGLEAPPHDAPGPFSLADRSRLERILKAAGFVEVEVAPHELVLHLGAGQPVGDWVHERLMMGPARTMYLEESPDRQREVRDLLSVRVDPFRIDAADLTAGLELPAAAWIVEARAR